MDYYIVDAFTDKLFGGNPACICILEKIFPDEVMQNIASENGLSEKAFIMYARIYLILGVATMLVSTLIHRKIQR